MKQRSNLPNRFNGYECFLLSIEFLSYALSYIYSSILNWLIIINQISLSRKFSIAREWLVGWVSFIPR